MTEEHKVEVELGGEGARGVVTLTGEPDAVREVLAAVVATIKAERARLAAMKAAGAAPRPCGGCGG